MARTPPSTTPVVHTPADVAGILHLHVKTVRLMLRAGEMEGMRVGRMWLVTDEQLHKFIDDHTVAA